MKSGGGLPPERDGLEDATDIHLPEFVRAPSVGRFALTIVEGSRVGETWESTGDRCVIGSHLLNDLRIEDNTVSRYHCEIVMEAEGARIVDLESKNGTFVDGMRIMGAYVRSGSLIRLGRAVLRFAFLSERNQLELSDRNSFGRLVGSSAPMRAAYAALERAARTDTTVLLEGETGTGKGQAAEALHAAGARAQKPLVVVDCASIAATLLEAELFGHEKGAFTGAEVKRVGAFEEAEGGSVFIDEIGELSPDLQPKLLRVLENRAVRRLGSNAFRPVNVRVIAATNRDLRSEVNAGRFRSDLYYRLAVVKIRLPALRERREDVAEIARSILGHLDVDAERVRALLTPAFVSDLEGHTWPGNARELRNYLERCLVFGAAMPHEADVEPGGSGMAIDISTPFPQARDRALADFERAYVAAILQRAGGDVAAAARAAGVSRVYLYRLMKRHAIRADGKP
jgi:two-component system, NtrC family, response regulator GlrR